MRAPEVPFFILKFKGLDPEKRYSCDFDGRVYSGSNLMNAGLNLTRSTAKLIRASRYISRRKNSMKRSFSDSFRSRSLQLCSAA